MVIRALRFLLGLTTAVVMGRIGASCATSGFWFPVWNLYVAAVVVSSSLMASCRPTVNLTHFSTRIAST